MLMEMITHYLFKQENIMTDEEWHKEVSARMQKLEQSTERKPKKENVMFDRSAPYWKAKKKLRKEFYQRMQKQIAEYNHKKELGIWEPIEDNTSSSSNIESDKLPRLPNRLANRRKKSHNKRR